jgi:hypothetical protein
MVISSAGQEDTDLGKAHQSNQAPTEERQEAPFPHGKEEVEEEDLDSRRQIFFQSREGL